MFQITIISIFGNTLYIDFVVTLCADMFKKQQTHYMFHKTGYTLTCAATELEERMDDLNAHTIDSDFGYSDDNLNSIPGFVQNNRLRITSLHKERVASYVK
jgi:hypothetical protein